MLTFVAYGELFSNFKAFKIITIICAMNFKSNHTCLVKLTVKLL